MTMRFIFDESKATDAAILLIRLNDSQSMDHAMLLKLLYLSDNRRASPEFEGMAEFRNSNHSHRRTVNLGGCRSHKGGDRRPHRHGRRAVLNAPNGILHVNGL